MYEFHYLSRYLSFMYQMLTIDESVDSDRVAMLGWQRQQRQSIPSRLWLAPLFILLLVIGGLVSWNKAPIKATANEFLNNQSFIRAVSGKILKVIRHY